jgi:pimeloyl-ACP methyl ester carboxylesterase
VADSETVSLLEGKFRVKVLSAGAGRPLLYLHGLEGMLEWPAWLDRYATRYRVIAPQMPGVGASTGLEHLEDIHDLALFYLDLLDALALDRPAAIGVDLGASIALEVAARCPHALERIVAVAPTGLWLQEAPCPDYFAGSQRELQRLAWHDFDAARERGAVKDPPADEESMRRRMLERQQTLTASGKFLWPIPDKGLGKRLHRIRPPVLLVWGTSDGWVPLAYGHAFSEGLSNARLAIIEEAGHLPMLEQAEEFDRAVLDFLA